MTPQEPDLPENEPSIFEDVDTQASAYQWHGILAVVYAILVQLSFILVFILNIYTRVAYTQELVGHDFRMIALHSVLLILFVLGVALRRLPGWIVSKVGYYELLIAALIHLIKPSQFRGQFILLAGVLAIGVIAMQTRALRRFFKVETTVPLWVLELVCAGLGGLLGWVFEHLS